MTVWDCFLFSNELQLLQFRLEYLADVVQRVVLVESPATFRGKPKPLHFAHNQNLFDRHSDRIIHVVAEGLDQTMPTAWVRERRQHAEIRKALLEGGIHDDDLVIVGDVDEVPSTETIRTLASYPPPEPVRLVLRHALYFANWELPMAWADGTMAALGKDLDHPDLGVLLGDPDAIWGTTREPKTPPSGWHFSYLGGPALIALKHEQLADTSFDNARDKDSSHLARCVRFGVHLAGRHMLRRLKRDELDPMQYELLRFAPERFNFAPSPVGAESYRAYTRIRRRLPFSMAKVADRVVPPLLPVLGPVVLAAERARDLSADHRQSEKQQSATSAVDVSSLASLRRGRRQ